jgi:hypothetical protein
MFFFYIVGDQRSWNIDGMITATAMRINIIVQVYKLLYRKEIIVRGPSYGWRLPKILTPPLPPPHRRGGRTRKEGGGVNILEDVRHSSVLYVC